MNDRRQKANRLRVGILIALALMATLISYWVLQVLKSEAVSGPVLKLGSLDYYADDFHAVHIASTGQANYRFSGSRMEHYPVKNIYLLEKVFAQSFEVGEPLMTAQSKKGRIDHDRTQIHLFDDVQVDRAATPKQAALRLKTQYLLILPDEYIARTDQPVEISQNKSVITGIGMVVNDKTGEFQLLKNVRANFVEQIEK